MFWDHDNLNCTKLNVPSTFQSLTKKKKKTKTKTKSQHIFSQQLHIRTESKGRKKTHTHTHKYNSIPEALRNNNREAKKTHQSYTIIEQIFKKKKKKTRERVFLYLFSREILKFVDGYLELALYEEDFSAILVLQSLKSVSNNIICFCFKEKKEIILKNFVCRLFFFL